MEKIDTTQSPYIDNVANTDDMDMNFKKTLVEKINEIIDWINSQG
tara:strand:+ start:997 stop:1131 length:135 start_codon:yes stop_codon:yes gene_type:complete